MKIFLLALCFLTFSPFCLAAVNPCEMALMKNAIADGNTETLLEKLRQYGSSFSPEQKTEIADSLAIFFGTRNPPKEVRDELTPFAQSSSKTN